MYDLILRNRYSEAVRIFSGKCNVDSVRRTLTLTDCVNAQGYSNTSEIIVWYDAITQNSKPLLLVERIAVEDVKLEDIKRAIAEFNDVVVGYVGIVRAHVDAGYVDITVVNENVYESMLSIEGETTN